MQNELVQYLQEEIDDLQAQIKAKLDKINSLGKFFSPAMHPYFLKCLYSGYRYNDEAEEAFQEIQNTYDYARLSYEAGQIRSKIIEKQQKIIEILIKEK